MKKLVSIFLVLLLCLSFAACGNTDTEAEATPTPTEEVTATPDATEEVPATLEAYIAGMQSEIDAMEAEMAEQGMSIKVEARGNSLVYSYQFSEDIADLETMKAAFEQSMESSSSVFENILTQIKAEIPSAESIIVEYLTKDGTEIYSKEFK